MPVKLNQKALTKYLNETGLQIHTVDDDGNPISKEAALADLLWKTALGWEEKLRDDDGNEKTKKHPPAPWAMQFVYERKEGKSSPAITESEGGLRASDKVRALARERLNGMVTALGKTPSTSLPPKHKPSKGE